MSRHARTRSLAAGLLAGAVAAGGLTTALTTALIPSPAVAAVAVHTASGLSARDIDGGTLQAPAALASWSEGEGVSGAAGSTTTPAGIRNGYTVTTEGTRTVAGVNGARTTVERATLDLRGRVPLVLEGLTVGCTPAGTSFTTIEKITVGGTDKTAEVASAAAGYRFALPSEAGAYDDAATVSIETAATNGAVRTVRGLRIDNGDNYELSSLTLGEVSCTTTTQPTLEPHRVAGVQVRTAGGTRLVEPTPALRRPGADAATAQTVEAPGYRSRATDVTTTTAADGTVTVTVGSFRQLPAEDSLAEYRPSALRVNGLSLTVAPGGASSTTFADPTNALFADGRWLNAQDGVIYTKLDPSDSSKVLLEVRIGERVDNGDGTVTVNALHYLDHTGTWPEVVLGQATVSTDVQPGPGPAPTPQPEGLVVPAGTWHSYGVRATGAVEVDASPLATLPATGGREATAARVDDAEGGQLTALDSTAAVSPSGGTAAVGDLELFPGTDAEIHLKDLRTVVDAAGARVSTGGGTVFGQTVAPGSLPIATTFTLPGTSTTAVLGAVGTDGAGLPVLDGLVLTSPDELATTVRAASVTVGRGTGAAPAPDGPGAVTPPAAAPAGPAVTELKTRAVRRGGEPAVRVRVVGLPSGVEARVVVRDKTRGNRVVKRARVGAGRFVLRLPMLSRGTHRLVVIVKPTATTQGDRSVVVVRR